MAGGSRGLCLVPQLPLQEEEFIGQCVSGFFGGLLPEADSRDQIARNLGISANNDFAMLERIGGECAGAIALLPGEMEDRPPAVGDVRWLDEGELVEIVGRLPQRPLLAGEEGLRLSLAGAQVKLPLVIDSTSGSFRVALPLGDTPSTHIIKPEPARFPGLAENEAWCMALARNIGLNAAEVSPEHFKQLCTQTKLGWPLARDRIKAVCRQILEVVGESQTLPKLRDAKVGEIVTQRAERMLKLLENHGG